MPPVWEAPTTVRAGDRAAGDVTGSVLGLGREVYRVSVGNLVINGFTKLILGLY